MKNKEGLILLFVSIGIAFLGVLLKDKHRLGLLTPIGILIGFFSVGYMFRGNWKDGIKWVSILLIISLLIFLTASFFR